MNYWVVLMSLCIYAVFSMPTKDTISLDSKKSAKAATIYDAKRNGSKVNIDAVEEIIKLSSKMAALEEKLKNEQAIIKEKGKEISGLHQDVDYQQYVIKRLNGKLTALNGKVAELSSEMINQGNIVKNQSTEIREKSIEIKVLHGDVDNQEKIIKNQSTEIKVLHAEVDKQEKIIKEQGDFIKHEGLEITEISAEVDEGQKINHNQNKQIEEMRDDVTKQGKINHNQSKQIEEMRDDVTKQGKINHNQSKQIEEISAKVDEGRKINHNQSKQIEELHMGASSGLCDPYKVVYFPRDTKTHQMKQCYTFGVSTPYYLHFVGYGAWGTIDKYEHHDNVTFDTCVSTCGGKRSEDAKWNGMWYRWPSSECWCLLNMRGFDPRFKDIYVLYSFTS